MCGTYFERLKKYGDKVIFFAAVLTAAVVTVITACQLEAVKAAEAQEQIAGEILRFHVLANSDSREDQELKLKVRDAVLVFLEDEMPRGMDLAQTEEWVRANTDGIEEAGRAVLEQAGSSYPVNAVVTTCYFPDKTYGGLMFPAGNYQALRVEIGAAKGHNWWCVLYPGLSFGDAVKVHSREEDAQRMENVLTEEEYSSVTAMSDFEISWYFWKGRER